MSETRLLSDVFAGHFALGRMGLLFPRLGPVVFGTASVPGVEKGTPRLRKSPTSRVTSVRPCFRAFAAIKPSNSRKPAIEASFHPLLQLCAALAGRKQFNAELHFGDGNDADEWEFRRNGIKPLPASFIRFAGSIAFRQDVCIEQEPVAHSSTGRGYSLRRSKSRLAPAKGDSIRNSARLCLTGAIAWG